MIRTLIALVTALAFFVPGAVMAGDAKAQEAPKAKKEEKGKKKSDEKK
jgi:hypothetical protein